MPPTSRLLSLPSVAALNQMIGGWYDRHTEKYMGVRIDTHAKLSDFFGECGIEVAEEASIGKKVRATVQRLNTTPAEHRLLRAIIEQVADPRYYLDDNFEPSLDYLNEKLRGDNLEVRESGGKYRLVATATNVVAASALQEKAETLDLSSVQRDFDDAMQMVESKPDAAIRAACATVESVCKCILDEMARPYPNKQDIKGLVGEVASHLNLSPGRDDLPKEWEQDIRMILSGLSSVVGGIGALRTHASDAHGKGKRPVPADARIARLAVHAASTVSLFYIETWQKSATSGGARRNRA